jgi:cell division protein FtsB
MYDNESEQDQKLKRENDQLRNENKILRELITNIKIVVMKKLNKE